MTTPTSQVPSNPILCIRESVTEGTRAKEDNYFGIRKTHHRSTCEYIV